MITAIKVFNMPITLHGYLWGGVDEDLNIDSLSISQVHRTGL